MPKMPDPGKHHGEAMFVGGGDDVFVADGAAGLDDGGDAGLSGHIHVVCEGEEGVGCQDGAFGIQTGFLGLPAGNARRIDAAHLTGADTDGGAVFHQHDGVRFDVLGDGDFFVTVLRSSLVTMTSSS